MRTIRTYCQAPLNHSGFIKLDESSSQHLSRVLRLSVGNTVELFNGDGFSYLTKISQLDKKQLIVEIIEQQSFVPSSPLFSEIAIAVSKSDKVDLIVQKATELGVNRISPIITQRTDVKMDAERWQKKQQRWQQIMISACEQCGRNDLAEVLPVTSFIDWAKACQSPNKIILHPRQSRPMQQLGHSTHIAACFGSEGGFTDDEINYALAQGFQPVSLGPRILRAETAPLAMLAIAQNLWGDFI